MNISIFGSGYVGLTTGVCFSEVGNNVTCVDIDASRVDALSSGNCPIFEPGLETLLKENIASKRLHFTTDAVAAIDHADIIFIAVGTPQQPDGSAKLDYVLNVAKTIGDHITNYKVIVDKSTVPVGTASIVKHTIQTQLTARGLKTAFDVASNPEFLKEGHAITDFLKPDRIIIGVDSQKAEDQLRLLYTPFNRNHDKLITMNICSAELTKYTANAMLATKISFMNEISRIAEHVGADIEKVRLGIGSDPRIGYSFIYPGCGYGGSCFPKDVQALAHTAKQHGVDARILNAVHDVNEQQKHVLFEKIYRYFEGNLANKQFAIWGLAFKPNTDDIRDAPSCTLIERLLQAGARIKAYDPEAMPNIQARYQSNDVTLCQNSKQTLDQSDALVILTEWLEFRSPDFSVIKNTLTQPAIFDGRNLYDPDALMLLGIDYIAIGRSNLSTVAQSEELVD